MEVLLVCYTDFITSYEHTITDLPAENEYPKLIRDRIPEIVEAEGREVATRTLEEDTEFLRYLLKKAVEEAEELAHFKNESNLLEEVADLREIIDTILAFKGISEEQIKAIQDEKREKRGGFKLRLLMLNND